MTTLGSLKTDAPGLLATLTRLIKPEQLIVFARDYLQVIAFGGAHEGRVVRESGASFNPRPARVVGILLADGTARSFQNIRLAVWSCAVSGEGTTGQLSNLPVDLQASAERVVSFVQGTIVPSTTIAELEVAISLFLDYVRHLHISELSPSEHRDELAAVDRVLAGLPGPTNELRLVKKLRHAIGQQERITELH